MNLLDLKQAIQTTQSFVKQSIEVRKKTTNCIQSNKKYFHVFVFFKKQATFLAQFWKNGGSRAILELSKLEIPA